MRHRPLLWAAVILTAGLACAPYLWPWRIPLCLTAICGALSLAAWYWWRRELSLPLAGLLILVGGMLLPRPPLAPPVAARVTAVRGWLDGEARIRANRAYQGARIEAWRLGNAGWSRPPKGLRLWLAGLPEGAAYGRLFEARGKLLASPSAGVDGYLFPKSARWLPGRAGNPLRAGGLAVRAAMDRIYGRFLTPGQHHLLAGLVLGDLGPLTDEALAAFRDAGVLHLLSVSGLHVGFVVVLVLGLASLLGWRGWRAWLLTVPALIGYVLLCGPKPPILRATVLALAAGAGAIRRRRIDPGNLLGLAAIVVLVCQPWALGTVSFQLSFAACAGLVFLYPRWAAWCPPRLGWIGKPFLLSCTASLAVLPIQLGAFGRASLIGPFANLVLVPLAGVATQIGLVAGLAGTLVPWLAGPVLAGLGVILDLMLAVARIGARIPGAALNIGAWPWPFVLGYYFLLGMVGPGMERNLLNRRARLPLGWLMTALAAVLAALVWWQVLAAPSGLSVTFLDAGQGDCIFVRAPTGQTALIDGGEDEAGSRVLSYLRKQGVNRLDLLIVSHPHSDHVGGLAAVAEEIRVGRVLDPGWPHPTETYRRFLLALKERGIPWQRARRGLSFTLGREVKGTVLYPQVAMPEPEDLNDGSLVIVLRYRDQAVLLPGDLGAAGEEALLATRQGLYATVLKVAHHGSATSTSGAWLAAVKPRAAVISVGRGNPFHHPSAEVLGRLAAAGVRVYRTDERGTVRWVTDGRRYRFETTR